MNTVIKSIDESNKEDQVLLCVPPTGSPEHSKFEEGVRKKVAWLQRRIKDYGYVGHIAYDNYRKPIGFIEFISSKGAPLPIEDSETTAIITCIDVPKAPRGQGIGTSLLKTALKQLWKIGVRQVKAVVSRSPQWINNGIYRKHDFQLEKTFCKAGCAEPFDMFTLRLDGPQPKIDPVPEHFKSELKDKLPVEVLYFDSAQCPWSSAVLMNHVNAVAKFSKEQAIFKTFDPWTHQEMAKRYGAMYFFDTFINGRGSFFGPPRQVQIEAEIQKEIDRVLHLKR